jgi:hypothetical protein
MDPALLIEYENAAQTFQVMQQMCEGHFLVNQDLLREQPTHSGDINLVLMVCNMLVVQISSVKLVVRMQKEALDLLGATLDCLTEVLQGPCSLNQDLVANHSCLGLVSNVLKIGPDEWENIYEEEEDVIKEVQNKAITMVAACLEGRKEQANDAVVHGKLADTMEATILSDFGDICLKGLQKYVEDDSLGSAELKEGTQDYIESLVSLHSVFNELDLIPEYKEQLHALQEKAKEDGLDETLSYREKFEVYVGQVEVYWLEQIEKVCFPLRMDISYLRDGTKNAFYNNVDLSTVDTRMKEAIEIVPVFSVEMSQIYYLARMSAFYRFVHHNLKAIKFSMYALVVLLNINVAMATYGAGITTGYKSITDALFNTGKFPIEADYQRSLYLSIVFGIINFIGYVIITCFLGITEIPIIIAGIDQLVKTTKIDGILTKEEYRDPSAWNAWFVTLVFNIAFIFMHKFNYPEVSADDALTLNLIMVLGINVPWTLSCIRAWIVIPDTGATRMFTIIYDVVITKSFFRNHVILMFCSTWGFQYSYFFTLMLLDIFSISEILQDVVRCMTDPGLKLVMVFYLFVVTFAIYATYGLNSFEDLFTYGNDDLDDAEDGCHSVVECFFLIFWNGIQGAPIGEVMTGLTDSYEIDTLARMLYDLSFFVWVGILLFNIISGLMLDAFAAIRENAEKRDETLADSCFVCGLDRKDYDNLNLPPEYPNFDTHKDEEHNVWNYIYFVDYILNKDPTEYTGVEQYVALQLEQNEMLWVPARNSFQIQTYNQHRKIQDEIEAEKQAEIEAESGGPGKKKKRKKVRRSRK